MGGRPAGYRDHGASVRTRVTPGGEQAAVLT